MANRKLISGLCAAILITQEGLFAREEQFRLGDKSEAKRS